MLILKYFLVVGLALTAGLVALSAHMTAASVAPVVVRAAAPVVAPPPPEPEPVVAAPVEQPPQQPAKAGSKSRRSHADRGKRQNSGVALR
ncbi:MAG TPA: hypothetical protein VI010_11695 [Xanthobacteraceae bacterium]|jgi:hypothetical protein